MFSWDALEKKKQDMLRFLKNASLSGPVKFLKDIDLEHKKLQKGKKNFFGKPLLSGRRISV